MGMEALNKNEPGLKTSKLNRRQAIHQKCLDCSGGHSKEVTECLFDDCPLYPFRSGRGHQIPSARSQAIKDYCYWCVGDQVREVSKCPSRNCPLYCYRKSPIIKGVKIDSPVKIDHREQVFITKAA